MTRYVVLLALLLGLAACADDHMHCTRSEPRTHLQPMIVGKTTMLMPYTVWYCVEWACDVDFPDCAESQ